MPAPTTIIEYDVSARLSEKAESVYVPFILFRIHSFILYLIETRGKEILGGSVRSIQVDMGFILYINL